MISAFFLLPGMAILNRASGMDRWFPGRNIYATAFLAAGLGFLVGSWPLCLALFFAMLAYRLPGWSKLIDVGKDAGKPMVEFLLLWARSLYFLPAFIPAYFAHHDLVVVGAAWLLSGLGCAMAYALVNWKLKSRNNLWAELGAGLSLGAGVCAALLIG